MRGRILFGIGRAMIPVPRFVWRRAIRANARKARTGLGFMSEDHHRVRDFVVMELPRAQTPLPPEEIASALGLVTGRVETLLDDLERHLLFLFRGDRRAVSWAYPVTVDPTPHRAYFGNGETAYSP